MFTFSLNCHAALVTLYNIVLLVSPNNVMPPPFAVISVGDATLPNSMFLSSTISVVVSSVVVVPLIVKSPSTTKSPAKFAVPVVNATVNLSNPSPNAKLPVAPICIRCTLAVKKSS